MFNLVILKCDSKAKFEKNGPFSLGSKFLTYFLKDFEGSFEELEFNSI